MKKFAKMLAMGMAMALTLGMTVSASGNDPVNPSTVTGPVFEGSDNVTIGSYDEDGVQVVFEATKEAVEENGVLDSLSEGKTMDTFQFVDAFDVTIPKGETGTVSTTINTIPGGFHAKDYGYSWGYVLIHFDDKMNVIEVIDVTKNGNTYSATVTGGSPYALVLWTLAKGANDHNLIPNKGESRDTYQDEHTAARIAIENEGQGNIVAQQYNAQYVFVKTMGSKVLNLVADSNVQFSGLDNLELGEAYIVLCYNNPQKISGAPDRHFLMTHKVADGAYNVTLPKGEYVAVVIKVSTDATVVPATPVVASDAAAPAVAAAGTTPAAGVVSPKTGEMLPVAVILAAICLAGAAVCVKKARTNA